MTKVPDPMLPPDSAPWGRYVNRELERMAYSSNKNDSDITNSLKATNATLKKLSDQVAALAEVTEELAEQQVALAAQQAALATQQGTLTAQQNYLSSLISRDASTTIFNTGTLSNDGETHLVGDQAIISNMPIATGKVRITISCSEASINTGTNAVAAMITFAIDGINSLDPNSRYARLYIGSGGLIGTSLSRVGTVDVPPGNYTIRAQAAYWCSGSGTSSIQFGSVRLLAEVINND